MRAAIRLTYGDASVLQIEERDLPVMKKGEVLIRVHAATVSRTDCHNLYGTPFIMRLFTGVRRPRLQTGGTDFAGEVVDLAEDVTRFKKGDRVVGFEFTGLQSHAQYLCLGEHKDILLIPDAMSFGEAAASVEGAFYAASTLLQLKMQSGQRALVYGATGAIGSAYVQFLKYFGLYVTAVGKGGQAGLMRSLGADKVIDYESTDFTRDEDRYDFVFDAVGKSSFSACKRLLKPKAIYTSSDGFKNILLALITPLFFGKRVLFIPPKDTKRVLQFILDRWQEGAFKPVIDRKYSLDQIREAYEYVGSGQKLGNVLIDLKTG